MVTAPRGRGEPSLSQTAGCKSSVVAMGDQRIANRGNVETKEMMEVEEKKEGKEGMEEEKSGKESKEEPEMEEKIENAQQSEKEEEEEKEKEKESKAVPLSRTSIAIPLPAILEVPATQESDRLFPR